jgi:uncharacterized protein (DUF58 family)
MIAVAKRQWRAWLNRRIPRADVQRFRQRNIFILPTGADFVFGLLLLIMLLTGINYQNSLIYLLTFLLGSVFVAAMHQTHRNLADLELSLIRPGEGFAGESVPFLFRAISKKHDSIAIILTLPGLSVEPRSILADQSCDLRLNVPARERGFLEIDRLRVETRFPFGLLIAWSWMRPGGRALVYPKPVTPPSAIAPMAEGDESARRRTTTGYDHAEIRPWREGDPVQRVLWKRYARTGEMVIADWEGEEGSPHWLDYGVFTGAEKELRLSYLAAQVLQRNRAGQLFGLRLPGQMIGPDRGDAHKRRCLRALALFDLPDGGLAGADTEAAPVRAAKASPAPARGIA